MKDRSHHEGHERLGRDEGKARLVSTLNNLYDRRSLPLDWIGGGHDDMENRKGDGLLAY